MEELLHQENCATLWEYLRSTDGKILLFFNIALERSARYTLLIFFLASLALRIFFVFATPANINESAGAIHPLNDEYSHFKYSVYLAQHKRLPVNSSIRNLDDPVAWTIQEFEYAQPPLYYLLSAPLTWLPNPLIACRLFSVILSSGTLYLALSCASILLRGKSLPIFATMIAFGFHPILVRVGSSVSNDNLAWFLSALQLRVLLSDAGQRHVIGHGVLTGLGLLTKFSFLIWPLFFLFRMIFLEREGKPLVKRVQQFVILMAVSFAISGWCFVRNQAIYSDYSGVIGGSGAPQALLSSGSQYWLEYFVNSAIRFSFFPIAEEHVLFFPLIEAIILYFVIAFLLQSDRIREEFSQTSSWRDILLFNTLSIVLFIMANLHWNFSEARLLFNAVIPLGMTCIAILNANFGWASLPLLVMINSVYYLSL